MMSNKRTDRITCAVSPDVQDVYRNLADSMRTSISRAVAFHLELTKDIAEEVSCISKANYDQIQQNYISEMVSRGLFPGQNDSTQ